MPEFVAYRPFGMLDATRDDGLRTIGIERPRETRIHHSNAEYWDFCVRFLRLYEACRDAGLDISVKSLDTYLWAVPGAT